MHNKQLTIFSILVCTTLIAIAISLLLLFVRHGDALAPIDAACILGGISCSVGSAAGMIFCGIAGRSPWHGILVGSVTVYGLILAAGLVFGIATVLINVLS